MGARARRDWYGTCSAIFAPPANLGMEERIDDASSERVASDLSDVTPVPTELLARLDRLATTSLLATGLAHELANPLASLVLSLDWTNERVDRMRKQGSAVAAELERLAPDLELARISTDAITATLRDFQMFLRPNEITP